MMLTPNQYQYLFSNGSMKRHGLERSFAHWPDATVPYKLDVLLSEEVKNLTFAAMSYISGVSCVKFEAADENAKNFVFITDGPGCSSAVGNLRQGRQNLKLSDLCDRGNIIHELLHTLGFLHMHVSKRKAVTKGFSRCFIFRQLHRGMITSKLYTATLNRKL